MLGSEIDVVEPFAFILGEGEHRLGSVGEAFETWRLSGRSIKTKHQSHGSPKRVEIEAVTIKHHVRYAPAVAEKREQQMLCADPMTAHQSRFVSGEPKHDSCIFCNAFKTHPVHRKLHHRREATHHRPGHCRINAIIRYEKVPTLLLGETPLRLQRS